MHNAPRLGAHLRCRLLQCRGHCQKPGGHQGWAAIVMTLAGLHGGTCSSRTASVGRRSAASLGDYRTSMPQPEGADQCKHLLACLRRPACSTKRTLPAAAAAARHSMPGRSAAGAAPGCWHSLISRQFGTSSSPRQPSGAGGGPPDNTDGRLSERYGLKRSVRVTALLGENGLVRGAGVVRAPMIQNGLTPLELYAVTSAPMEYVQQMLKAQRESP